MTIDDIRQDATFAQRLLRFAGYDCGTVDGVWGKRTEAAWQSWLSDARVIKNECVCLDDRSERCLATLIPSCQFALRMWFGDKVMPWAEKHGCSVKIICGTRSFCEQDKLYAQGRTAPGAKVTNAKGGFSNHNFGVAVDLGIFVKGKYEEGDALYRKLHADCGCPDGFLWGGEWKSCPDSPHYQLARYGSGVSEIRKHFLG